MNDKSNKNLNAILNQWLRVLSEFLAQRKGLPVLIGILLVFIGLVLNLLPPWPVVWWFADTQILLHLGVLLGLLGILIGDAL